jgi:peptidoglycan/xylan/chitin deacetylase (PgdA/CDA1 family)
MRERLNALATGLLRDTRTRVTVCFDDASASHWAAAALLASAGLRGSFFVNSSRLGSGRDYLTWKQLEEMAAAGHEIGGHTLTHPDLTRLPEADVIREIGGDRLALLKRGFEATSFAYPYGAYNASLRRAVRRAGYSAGRAGWGLRRIGDPTDSRSYVETVPPRDRYAIRTACCIDDAGVTVDTIKQYILAAERTRGWVTLVFHDLVEGESERPFAIAGFAALVEWLAARQAHGTLVQTLADVVLRRDPDGGGPLPSPDRARRRLLKGIELGSV